MTSYRINQAVVEDDIDDAILDHVLNIAHGSFTRDMNFKNVAYTGETFLTMLSKFERGVKDGRCILSGAVVDPVPGQRGTPRVAPNMKKNYLMMVDFDQGDTVDEVAKKANKHGLFCVIWTTHSHMKTTSSVPEKALLEWLARTKNIKTKEASEEQLIAYFRELIGMREEFLTEAAFASKEMEPGGKVYKLKHAPMSRCRALFILEEPFDFATRPGSQQDAIDEWKSYYLGLCENVLETTAYDPKCLDPSRLMYLPRIAEDADISQHEIRIIPGTLLDLKEVTPVERNKRVAPVVSNAFTQAALHAGVTGDVTFKTTGLKEFLAKYAADFEAESWLDAYDQTKQCPFADRHSATVTGIDMGFKAWNASGQDSGFGMQCSHTCGADPDRGQNANTGKQDRGKYLDALCVKFGIADANALIDYCPHAEAQAEETRQAGQKAIAEQAAVVQQAQSTDAKQEERIRGFNENTPAELIDGMIRLMAARPDTTRVSQLMKLLKEKTHLPLAELNKTLARFRRQFIGEQAAAEAAAAAAAGVDVVPNQHPLPETLDDIVAIWEDWHFKDQSDWTLRWFEHENQKDPRVYTRPEGGCLRVEDAGKRAVVAEMTHGMWAAELNKLLTFRRVLLEADGSRSERGVAPFKPLITDMYNRADRPYPLLDRIVRTPIFGPEGTIRTLRGYDHGMGVYIDPDPGLNVPPVSEVPSDDEVATARSWLFEAGRDFPFSDVFSDTDGEELDVKEGEPDARGYREPNLLRGQCSRINFIAALIQPFVRNMITSPCPAYCIVKPIMGSGAGYMADAISIITEGQKAAAQPMSKENEEFRKSITATLRSGAGLIFIDNISRKIDSGELAAAITAGSWRDRVIMSSNVVDIPVKALWLFAGNRNKFTDEIARRFVPIKIDPAVESATNDRPPETYMHFPYQPWLFRNRGILVWAALTLISNWVAKGRPVAEEWCNDPERTVTMHSFDDYADVMGGILATAGFPQSWRFLGNAASFHKSAMTELGTAKHFLQLVFDRFKFTEMGAKDMLMCVTDPFGNLTTDIPVDSKHESQRGKELRAYLDAHAVGKVFKLSVREGSMEADDILGVKLLVRRQENPVTYGFFQVSS